MVASNFCDGVNLKVKALKTNTFTHHLLSKLIVVGPVAIQVVEVLQFALPETNIAYENPIFPSKYQQNGGFSMAMLVSGRVFLDFWFMFCFKTPAI